MTNRFSSVQGNQNRQKASRAFTIVELLIVIVVIAILAAITVISYRGVTSQSKEAALKTELRNAADKIKLSKLNDSAGKYPASLSVAGVTQPKGISYTYTGGGTTFCLKATNPSLAGKAFYITQEGSIEEGDCPITDIQTITASTCPTERTVVKDARDNHTYWIQKLADGKCWMLTNLAYAGGGTNTYNDTMPTGDGTGGTLNGPDNASSYIYSAKYNIPNGANPTTAPTQPSTSTDGGVTNPQYGYLYNWCAAMKGQTATSACMEATAPLPDTTKSICPAGWRLPTGGSGGELEALNAAINSGSTSSTAGLLNIWLAQYGGYWNGSFNSQGSYGLYRSSTQNSSTYAYYLQFYKTTGLDPLAITNKGLGQSIRCLAA